MKNKAIIAGILSLLCLFSSCKNNESSKGESNMGNEIYELKTDIVSDRQYYTDGEVQFPNSLWETPKATSLPEFDKYLIVLPSELTIQLSLNSL